MINNVSCFHPFSFIRRSFLLVSAVLHAKGLSQKDPLPLDQPEMMHKTNEGESSVNRPLITGSPGRRDENRLIRTKPQKISVGCQTKSLFFMKTVQNIFSMTKLLPIFQWRNFFPSLPKSGFVGGIPFSLGAVKTYWTWPLTPTGRTKLAWDNLCKKTSPNI